MCLIISCYKHDVEKDKNIDHEFNNLKHNGPHIKLLLITTLNINFHVIECSLSWNQVIKKI